MERGPDSIDQIEDINIYTPRPITSGPTQYSSHGLLSTLVWGYMIFQFFTKLMIAGGFSLTNCIGCSSCNFCLFLFFTYLILAFNVWPLGYLTYKQHLARDRTSPMKNVQTIERFTIKEGGIFNWGFLLFLI